MIVGQSGQHRSSSELDHPSTGTHQSPDVFGKSDRRYPATGHRDSIRVDLRCSTIRHPLRTWGHHSAPHQDQVRGPFRGVCTGARGENEERGERKSGVSCHGGHLRAYCVIDIVTDALIDMVNGMSRRGMGAIRA